MGFYINPPHSSKEVWLKDHAIEIRPELVPAWDANEQSYFLLICLVDNGAFTAAGICVDEEEKKAFARPDGREKKWYVAPISLFNTENWTLKEDA